MGTNGDLDRYTYAELNQLHADACQNATRLFTRAEDFVRQARELGAGRFADPRWQSLMDSSTASRMAGETQQELAREIFAACRQREAEGLTGV